MPIVNQIPASDIGSKLAVGVQYADYRTGVPLLQQRLYVVGQGRTGITQPVEKFVANSPGEIANLVGFGSPLHLMALRLWPRDGNGLSRGAIETTFFALEDADGSVAAEKSIDSVGTQTQASDYVLHCGDFKAPFVLSKDDTGDDVLNAMKDAIEANPAAPITVGLAAGAATAGRMITGNIVGSEASFIAVTDGSFVVSIDGAAPAAITGLDFSLDTDYADFATTITTALTGATCAYDSVTNKFTITSSLTGEGKDVSALSVHSTGTDISGGLFLNGRTGVAQVIPGTDADNILTAIAKWKGTTSNETKDIRITGKSYGVTFIFEDVTVGAGNPDIQAAIDAMGSAIWYTLVLQQFATSTALDVVQTRGNAEWQPLIHRPFHAYVGESSRTTATSLMSARKLDKINGVIVAYDAPAFSFEIGARVIAEIASMANLKPNVHYNGLVLSGLTPGSDISEPDGTGKETDLKAGVSTTMLEDGVLKISDVVTSWRPDDEQPDPGYRWTVDVVKLQNILNSMIVQFKSVKWRGKTLLADIDQSNNEDVVRAKEAAAAILGMATDWLNNAWITDIAFLQKNLVVVKATGVRNRMESIIPLKVSDQLRQQDHLLKFGFAFA